MPAARPVVNDRDALGEPVRRHRSPRSRPTARDQGGRDREAGQEQHHRQQHEARRRTAAAASAGPAPASPTGTGSRCWPAGARRRSPARTAGCRAPRSRAAARERLAPSSSANATVATSAPPNSDAHRERRRPPAGSSTGHGIGRSAVAGGAGAGGRLGAPLRGERRGADEAGHDRRAQPGQRVHGGGEQGHQRSGPTMNTDSSTTASNANAVCSCRLSGDQVRPPRPDARADLRHARRRRRAANRCGQRRPAVQLDGDHHQHQPDARRPRSPTGSTRLWPSRSISRACSTAQQRVGDQVRRRHRPGQRVGAGAGRDQQHDAEADHRDRQPRDQPAQRERQGSGQRQHPAVGRRASGRS